MCPGPAAGLPSGSFCVLLPLSWSAGFDPSMPGHSGPAFVVQQCWEGKGPRQGLEGVLCPQDDQPRGFGSPASAQSSSALNCPGAPRRRECTLAPSFTANNRCPAAVLARDLAASEWATSFTQGQRLQAGSRGLLATAEGGACACPAGCSLPHPRGQSCPPRATGPGSALELQLREAPIGPCELSKGPWKLDSKAPCVSVVVGTM